MSEFLGLGRRLFGPYTPVIDEAEVLSQKRLESAILWKSANIGFAHLQAGLLKVDAATSARVNRNTNVAKSMKEIAAIKDALDKRMGTTSDIDKLLDANDLYRQAIFRLLIAVEQVYSGNRFLRDLVNESWNLMEKSIKAGQRPKFLAKLKRLLRTPKA